MRRSPLFALLALCLAPALAHAQPAAPSVSSLRDRIAALEAHRPAGIPRGTITSIGYLVDVSERISDRFEEPAASWRSRAGRYLDEVEAGRDPYPTERNVITNRGYDSPSSVIRQGYAIYLPPDYDPSRRYPLLVMLHGGSSNGNLFLGVVLGNNMDWLTYHLHLWDDYEPRWSPDWIVVAPDGYGQVLWRWMGEDDLLRVIDDVQEHYAVDDQHIVLGGLSNGGVGAYAVGMRHAYRFSMVTAIAGCPSWLLYTGGSPTEAERTAMMMQSGWDLVDNSTDTDFRFYHGTVDPGPMRPAFVHAFEEHMNEIGIPPQVTWYEMGHDLLYVVHRHGRFYTNMLQPVRDARRAEVRLVTGDYRANRQHWVTAERIVDYPRLSRTIAHAADGEITIETERVSQLALDLRDAPIGRGDTLRIVIDGSEAYSGPRAPLGHVIHLARTEGGWHPGFLPTSGLAKVPGLSGPITDATRDAMIHVYGTQIEGDTDELRRAAERGSRGWVQGLWNYRQLVVADTALTEEQLRTHHVVLYGTPGSNSVLERVAAQLPIHVERDGVHVGERVYSGAGIGVRFIYPNPLPEGQGRYVIVQAAPTAEGVGRGNNLPDFVPDWVVYDAAGTRTRPRLISGRAAEAMGFFDDAWQLREESAMARGARRAAPSAAVADDDEGGDDGPRHEVMLVQAADAGAESDEARAARIERNHVLGMPDDFVLSPEVLRQTPPVTLPYFTPVPAVPPVPRHFAVAETDPAGPIARRLARRIPSFPNYRAIVPGGEWRIADDARWSVRPEADCLADLRAQHIRVSHLDALDSDVARPYQLDSAVDGVTFAMTQRHAEEGITVALSCEMIARLPALARVLRAHHVRRVEVLSAYRDHPRSSFHTMGLALDMASFTTDDGHVLSVLNDFVETPDALTCEAAAPADHDAAELLAIACELADSHAFSSVLTPNYNDGHRNHFHVDVRPDDPRVFVR